MWTQFMDMHSGGGQKLDWGYIYIEAPQDEAELIFQNRFGRNPNRVTCTCCGEDYSISEDRTLARSTAYERNCDWDDKKERYIEKQESGKMDIRSKCDTPDLDEWGLYQTLQEYKKKESVLFIHKKDIKPKEREGELEEEGYVWK